MRDKNQGRQQQQEQSNERNSQNLGYEQTGSSPQQQQQRGKLQNQERGGIGEQSERSSTDKGRLSESESV
jgi:hypothetical protein